MVHKMCLWEICSPSGQGTKTAEAGRTEATEGTGRTLEGENQEWGPQLYLLSPYNNKLIFLGGMVNCPISSFADSPSGCGTKNVQAAHSASNFMRLLLIPLGNILWFHL